MFRADSIKLTVWFIPTLLGMRPGQCDMRSHGRSNTLAQVSLKVRNLSSRGKVDRGWYFRWRNKHNNPDTPRSVVDKSNIDEAPPTLAQNPRNDSLYSSPTTQFAPDSDCAVPLSSRSLDDSPTSVYQDAQSAMDITRKVDSLKNGLGNTDCSLDYSNAWAECR